MKHLKRLLCLCLSIVIVLGLTACGETPAPSNTSTAKAELLSMDIRPDMPAEIPEGLDIDWNHRYTYAELEAQMAKIAETYPDVVDRYAIGSTWQERSLWCLEFTNRNIPAEDKIGIGVFGNIHGGERETASSTMYMAWWLALCSGDDYVKSLLDNYIIYVIPSINPDGYEQSFVLKTRPNLRPQDANGDNIPFSDPYTDIDGDGFIAQIYRGTAEDEPAPGYFHDFGWGDPGNLTYFGMESPDWDGNGILGDDPRNSGIDMNRTFDYQWNRYDIETAGTDNQIGNINWTSAGTDAATEPEIQAVQQFIHTHPMAALTTIHTGIQCVLYPWCYRPYDANDPKDAEIPFMKETAAKMAQTYQDYTGRGFYTMSSNEDYPTAAEMIDYAYGRYNIHSYTIEVYDPGKSETGDISECKWENNIPDPKWVFYAYDEIQDKLGLDPAAITGADGSKLSENEGLWFFTNSEDQMVNEAPENQDLMVRGCRDAILTMIHSEPNGAGYQNPGFYK